MKNASFLIASCILLSFLIPFSVNLTKTRENPGEFMLKTENNGEMVEMSLEDYVLCVLRQEVPSYYEKEALKAQAVAIRSYALRKFTNTSHLCTDFKHCMAYLSRGDAMKKWGKDFKRFESIYKNAVEETKNQVLYYNNEIANTVFFAISSGRTENAEDVWGGKVPYLVSTESKEDLSAERLESRVEFDLNEFREKLGVSFVNVTSVERTESGMVKTMTISDKTFKGNEIRSLFSLRSANFEIEVTDKVIFKVKGYGHGVGMSQNGANECAKKGMNYKDILFKYYKGTRLVDLFEK